MNNDPEYLKALAELERLMPTGDPESARAVAAVHAMEVRAMNDGLQRYVPVATGYLKDSNLEHRARAGLTIRAICDACGTTVDHVLFFVEEANLHVCRMCYVHEYRA